MFINDLLFTFIRRYRGMLGIISPNKIIFVEDESILLYFFSKGIIKYLKTPHTI